MFKRKEFNWLLRIVRKTSRNARLFAQNLQNLQIYIALIAGISDYRPNALTNTIGVPEKYSRRVQLFGERRNHAKSKKLHACNLKPKACVLTRRSVLPCEAYLWGHKDELILYQGHGSLLKICFSLKNFL